MFSTNIAVSLITLNAISFHASLVRADFNATIPASNATYSGTWSCATDGAGSDTGDIDACALGCRTSSIGNSLQISFQGTAAWLTLQQSTNSTLQLSIALDASTTTYFPQSDAAPGCTSQVVIGSDLDSETLHTLAIVVEAAGVGDVFVFGGLTVNTDSIETSTTSDGTAGAGNTSGRTTFAPSPGGEHFSVVVGILSGVVAFWLIAGTALWYFRSRRRSMHLRALTHVQVMSFDEDLLAGKDSRIDLDSGAHLETSLEETRTNLTISSGSSYPTTVSINSRMNLNTMDGPASRGRAYSVSTNTSESTAQPDAAIDPVERRRMKLERELAKGARSDTVSRVRVQVIAPTPSPTENDLSPPPLYTPNKERYANGLPRNQI